ncbi:PREDICTED: telomere-associated protein RIF1 [Calidris pugnax]|uniref:telomere-associated protein RIF1 n=1 Tax=Calidris pugnax TaxID=198806 RepID=UPI00071D9061|nr:PREDICTED: telomere-associated protein RIF1 [Calidris pugnax]
MKHQKQLVTEYQQNRSEDPVEMLHVVYTGFKKTTTLSLYDLQSEAALVRAGGHLRRETDSPSRAPPPISGEGRCPPGGGALQARERIHRSALRRARRTRLTGEEGKEFTADVKKHFPKLCRVFKAHISDENSALNNAALQALGFCVFNSSVTSALSATEIGDLLSTVNSVAVKTSDKNTRTRALWVISKQAFPSEIVKKEVSNIISTLETILTKGDVQSMVVEYEALNVIIRLMEQTPAQMGEEAVRWAKLIIPLVVHSAHKVQLRGATALEMGMPLLLQKQQEVAAITEHLMTTKLISELQKLFSSKNETYVLKLWPLFVKLLGKTLHRSGSFINSLLQLEELGFRSGSPVVKKIAFIAWKSLIDNFALNPDILCSAKRLKLLMQPLSSIHVRTEALALTKLEVWWYLLMRLGPQLPANFEQVCVPLIQSTLSLDSATPLQGTPSRAPANQSLALATPTSKSGPYPFANAVTPRMNLASSPAGMVVIPSIQLLGIEMLLHFLMGPEVVDFAKQNKLALSLEPLQYPLISSPSFFCKHASTFINAVQDGFIAIGKEVPDCMLNVIWKDINGYVKTAIESGNKKEKQGSEILTMLLQALKNTVRSNSLPVQKILSLIDITVKELPSKVLGSPAYQVADMDLLNGTPALFLIQLPFHNNLLESCVTEERFFVILTTLVGFVLSGPTSPLAFSESVVGILNQSAKQVENKEHLWRMWSIVVNPLTEWINRTNEVNQGDALEHNFNAVYSALLLPVSHIFPVQEFPQPTMKSLLRTWSELYRAFARCAALVATAEENLCCEELCAKIISGLEGETPVMFAMMDGLTHIISVMVDCLNFAPYGTKYQPKNRSPQTPTDWSKRKKEPLGKLSSLFKLLVMLLNSFHVFSSKEACSETLLSVGPSIIAVLHNIISRVSLPSVIGTMFAIFSKPLAVFYEKTKLADVPKVYSELNNKLEKLLAEIIQCVQSHCTGSYDSDLLAQLSPLLCVIFQHKNKQIRHQCAHFWNTTFAKAASLTYPEELKSVLSQAKKNIPLLLPAFESVEMAEEYSGPFSDAMENSQLDAKISGMEVKLGQKRDSILAQTSELKNEGKDKPSNVQVTSAKLKLEFSSSKTKSEILLEEEKSVDFVFIPPETKERILTEHQKEVLRSKRADIPAMYNNLDASQDTTLFSQYTQSQEDSLGKPSLIENAKEDTKAKPQEENAKSEGRQGESDEMVGGCKPAHPPENAACGEEPPVTQMEESSTSSSRRGTQRDAADAVPGELSVGEGLETSAVDTASKEPSVGNETTSNLSSSSSSDVISGTPQPASRRQSFITLEKFGSSVNRPFGLSVLNSIAETPGSTSVAGKQENTSVCKTGAKPEKSGEENTKPSKSEPEQGVTAARRLTRRQSKLEHQENKQSKVSLGSEQESPASSSTENSPELSSAVENIEEVLLNQSRALHSAEEDIVKVEGVIAEIEKVRKLDMDSKENTPPEATVSPEQVTGDNSQVPQVSPTQKIPRRSLRRRSEAVESAAGSQDKEDGHQKRRKEDEKSGPKKVPQTRDDASQKQKAVSGKTTENTNKESNLVERTAVEEEEVSAKESPASRGLDEEANKSGRRPEDTMKSDAEGQDGSSGVVGQKKVERPRYHTRRASQGLLSSIENSEADGYEPKEESTRKKRSAKLKNRSDSLESKSKDLQPGSQSHEVSSQGNDMKNLLEASQGELSPEVGTDAAVTSEVCDPKHQEVPAGVGKAEASAGSKDLPDAQNVNVDQKSSMSVESFSNSCVSDQDLKAPEDDKHVEKQATEEECCPTILPEPVPGGNASGDDLSSSPAPEGQNKRSRRVKRGRSCDCCGTKPKQQILSVTGSKTESAPELNESQPSPVQTPLNPSEVSGNSSLDESLSLAPCAMSTPVHPPKEPTAFDLGGEGRSEDDLQGSVVEEEGLEDAEGRAGETTDAVVDVEEPADQSDGTGQCLSEGGAEEPGDSSVVAGNDSEEPVATEKEEMSQNGQPEEIPEAPIDVSETEKNQLDEPESNWGNEEAAENSVGEICTIPNEEVKEELVETEITVPENAALETEGAVEGNGVGSPQKLEDDHSFALANESPNGMQARCTWSPSASPSTSILKRGVKRSQDDDSLSPANKIRRVSFADPIYQEGLADDIDRRSPVVRSHSSSPSSRSLKILSNIQAKLITTPTKGFLSPGSRNPKFKSSKKCLITEMAKESLLCPTECVYPALAGCKVPVDVILPQITSNICARGLGQLIRAKNIKTVGDLSTLSASQIKTLPIRSPKVSNVKKVLKGYHEQQVKSRGFEEISALEDAEKPINNIEEKSLCVDEEKLATDLLDVVSPAPQEQAEADLPGRIEALAAQLAAEDLHSYSGSQLFEMQEKLVEMTNCIMRNLRARWKSPPHDASD